MSMTHTVFRRPGGKQEVTQRVHGHLVDEPGALRRDVIHFRRFWIDVNLIKRNRIDHSDLVVG